MSKQAITYFYMLEYPLLLFMRLPVRCAKPHVITACENINGNVKGLSTVFPSKRRKPASHTSTLGIRW